MKVFVDTNIFLRFLLADHSQQSPACKKLFQKAAEGQIQLVTLPIVMAEVAWVLSSHCRESRSQIADKLRIILLFKGLEIPDRQILLLTLKIFESQKIDFIDAYVASWIEAKKLKQIYSYDRDFDKIERIERKEPKFLNH